MIDGDVATMLGGGPHPSAPGRAARHTSLEGALAECRPPRIDLTRGLNTMLFPRPGLAPARGHRGRPPRAAVHEVEYEPSPGSVHGLTSATAVALEQQSPGPWLVADLTDLELAEVDDATVVEAIAGWERVVSWAAAQQARATAELSDRRGPTSAALASAASEIGSRLGITGRAAEVKLGFGAALSAYPEVADALHSGHIDTRKADVLVTTEPGLTHRQQRRVQREVLPEAHELTAPQLRARLRRAALTVDPDAGAGRRAKAFAERRVCVDPAGDAMSWVSALVRCDHAEMVRTALDALARGARTEDDGRTVDQRRADAFTDVFTALLNNGVDLHGAALPTRHRQRPHIQVTVGAGTLLGLDGQPAVLGGHGPIPAELARQIAQDGTWRGLFTDAAGAFVALGAKKYVPGADLTRQVIARDGTCTFPGCRQPAVTADLDHIVAYDPAVAKTIEQTTTFRLQALCRRHHNLKTTKFWRAKREESGAIVWTAPTGHRYTRAPDRPPASGVPPASGSPPARPPGPADDAHGDGADDPPY